MPVDHGDMSLAFSIILSFIIDGTYCFLYHVYHVGDASFNDRNKPCFLSVLQSK